MRAFSRFTSWDPGKRFACPSSWNDIETLPWIWRTHRSSRLRSVADWTGSSRWIIPSRFIRLKMRGRSWSCRDDRASALPRSSVFLGPRQADRDGQRDEAARWPRGVPGDAVEESDPGFVAIRVDPDPLVGGEDSLRVARVGDQAEE